MRETTTVLDLLENVTQQTIQLSLVISPNLPMFLSVNELKHLTAVAAENAIREVASALVESTVTMAAETTTEFILKDFCLEGNEEAVKKAAHNMVSPIAQRPAVLQTKSSDSKVFFGGVSLCWWWFSGVLPCAVS